MAYSGNKGIKRILLAAGYSWAGFKAAWKNEEAFRQELILAVVFIPLAFYLQLGGVETALLVSSILLILIVEILNSAIEALVDLVTTEQHELAGRAKDMGYSAVMLALINATVV